MGRPLRRAVVGMVVVLLASGCVGSDPSQKVADAGDVLTGAGGARVEISSQLSGGDLPEPVELSVAGSIDLARMLTRLEGNVRGSTSATAPRQVSVAGDRAGPGTRTVLTEFGVQGGDDVAVEMVTDPASLYLRSDLFDRMLPRGASWLQVDLQEPVSEQNIPSLDLLRYWNPNPAREVALLSGARSVEQLDDDEVRGDAVTSYRVDIDVAEAIASSEAPERALLERFSDLLADERVQATVWFDAEDRLRRMSRTLELELSDGAGRFTHEQTLELFEFDTAVEVAPPPGSETADLAGMLKGWGSVDPRDAFVDVPGYEWGPPSEQIVQQLLDEIPEEDQQVITTVIARELKDDGEPVAVGIVMQAVPSVAGSPEFRRNLLVGLADDCGDVKQLPSTVAEDYICQGQDVTIIMWFNQSLVTTIVGPDRPQLETIAAEMHGQR